MITGPARRRSDASTAKDWLKIASRLEVADREGSVAGAGDLGRECRLPHPSPGSTTRRRHALPRCTVRGLATVTWLPPRGLQPRPPETPRAAGLPDRRPAEAGTPTRTASQGTRLRDRSW